MLDEMLARTGSPKLADLDAGRQRAYARALIAALAQAESQGGSDDEPAPGDLAKPAATPGSAAPAPQPQPPQPDPAERTGGVLGRLFGPWMPRKR
jgi:hypothetical protein